MKINGIVRLFIIAASLLCSALISFAQADSLSFEIDEPTVNSVISKTPMSISISFRSPIDVNSVEAYIDNKLLVRGNLSKPIPNGHFSVPADYKSLRLTSGKHFLTVKLFDILGKVAQRTVGITLQSTPEKNPPIVRITNPKDGDVVQFDQDVQITVDATDDSGIKWVFVYINNEVRAMMNVAPYIAPWNPMRENFTSGAYILTAKAVDLFENPAISKPITVTFNPGGKTPLKTVIEAYNPISSGAAVFPTFGKIYNRFSATDLLNQGWADGIPTGLPQMMMAMQSRSFGMDNSASNQIGTLPMIFKPENINETIAGTPVMALTMPPALSAISGMVNPMSIKGYSYTPMYSSLPAPAGEALPRTGVTENPLVSTEAMGSKTATSTTIKNPTINTAQAVSQKPGAGITNVPQQDVIFGKGKFTGNPSTLDMPNTTDMRVADLSNPMMIAKIPGKVNTGIDSPQIGNAVTTANTVGYTPSTGTDTTKISNTSATTLTRPGANAPVVENNINGKNIQTTSPGITANNPTRVTPQITAPATASVENVSTATIGNVPTTGGNINKMANTSTTSLNRPSTNAPTLDSSFAGKNVQTVNPGITTNNPTRVTPQINAPATTSVENVSTTTIGNVPTTGGNTNKIANTSTTSLNRPGANAPALDSNSAGKNVQTVNPGITTNNPTRVTPQITAPTTGTADVTTSTIVAPSTGNDNIKPITLSNGQIAPTRSNVTISDKSGSSRSVATAVPTVKGSSSKISPKGTNTTGNVNTVIAQPSNVTPANPTVNQQIATGTKITTRTDPGNPSTIATTGRNAETTTPDVKIAGGITIHNKSLPGTQTQSPAIITNNSTNVNPTMGGNVTKGSVSSDNVSTRTDPGNPSTIATTGRNTETTTPDVKIAGGITIRNKPLSGTQTQSPAIITNNSTNVNPTMGGNVTKGSVSSDNVSTRGTMTNLSQTTSNTGRNTTTTTPDVKISSANVISKPTSLVPGPATAIVNSSTIVKPSTTGNVSKPVATNANVSAQGEIKNTVVASIGSRNNTTSIPEIKNSSNQTRIDSPVKTNRNNIVVPQYGSTEVTVEVIANYVASKGDTLEKIASVNNTSVTELMKMNSGLSPKSALSEGTNIKIKQQPATLYVDNNQIKGYPTPILVNGDRMVPFRAVVQAKDGTVVWIASTKEVNAWIAANKAFIKMKIGDKTATVNNQPVTMKNAPMIEKSRTMVEVNYLAAAMNLEYKYNPLSNTYYFASKKSN